MSTGDLAAAFAGTAANVVAHDKEQHAKKRSKSKSQKAHKAAAAEEWVWPEMEGARYDLCMEDPVLQAILAQKVCQDATIDNEAELRKTKLGKRVDDAKERQQYLQVRLYTLLDSAYHICR